MPSPSGDRSRSFPAIERAYGQPVSYWLEQLAALGDDSFRVRLAFLTERHGFSRAHATTLVQWSRGSTSTQRYTGPDDFFARLTPVQRAAAQAVFDAITSSIPDLELVMAWNQPMLRRGRHYVFGLSVATKHLTINPWSTVVLETFHPRLEGLTVNKHTFGVPLDWKVDAQLLCDMVRARVAELD